MSAQTVLGASCLIFELHMGRKFFTINCIPRAPLTEANRDNELSKLDRNVNSVSLDNQRPPADLRMRRRHVFAQNSDKHQLDAPQKKNRNNNRRRPSWRGMWEEYIGHNRRRSKNN